MALILMCGQPCSGKSRLARTLERQIKESIERSNDPSLTSVSVIDEPSLNVSRKDGYKDMVSEKNVRGELRSAVDREVTKGRVVIVDSLNGIKGYRYELWCLARAAGANYCLVYCDVSKDLAREWNKLRSGVGEPSYPEYILEDLLCRFEVPLKHNRWDSPLFEVYPGKESLEETAATISQVVSLVINPKKAGNGGKGPRNLQPTMATQNAQISDTNLLYEMDRAAQEVINTITEAQATSFGSHVPELKLGEGLPIIQLHRVLGLPELRRHKRTFLKLAGQSSLTGPGPARDAISIKRLFVDYLSRQIATDS